MKQQFDMLVRRISALSRRQILVGGAAVACLAAGSVALLAQQRHTVIHNTDISSQTRRAINRYRPTEQEWANLVVAQVGQQAFRAERTTEGKIALNEDHATPVFSPYSGRVTRLLVKPGDKVERGQPLFTIEATDTVQSLNDLMAAASARNKATSQVGFIQTVLTRNRDLYEARAVPLRDLQKAENDLTAAQNDIRAADTALEAARNRARLLGRSDDELAAFQQTGKISAETTVVAPLAGTIVQRKVGPGQYLSAGASDPVFVVGDLATVWLSTYVRETDAQSVKAGQTVNFSLTALPGKIFAAKIDYVSAALETGSRRLLVRATVDNAENLLKPEMLASVDIFTDAESTIVAVPREALVHDGPTVSVWVVREDRTIELRRIKTGMTSGTTVQVAEGLSVGDKIIVRGNLLLNAAS